MYALRPCCSPFWLEEAQAASAEMGALVEPPLLLPVNDPPEPEPDPEELPPLLPPPVEASPNVSPPLPLPFPSPLPSSPGSPAVLPAEHAAIEPMQTSPAAATRQPFTRKVISTLSAATRKRT